MGMFTKERITFQKPFRNVILTLSWFESLILPFVNAKLFQIRRLKRKKKGVLDRDPPRKPDFTFCECKALSERDSCVRILEMCAEAMHGSICAVGTKYLAMRRSCSWLGWRLQRLWMHVVQITNPITNRVATGPIAQTWPEAIVMIHPLIKTWLALWNVILRMQLKTGM